MDPYCRYDLKGFSNDLGLPIEDIADLFSDLIKEINSEIHEIKTYLKKKDLEQLKRINHNIKGISANYRIQDIYEETLKISYALTKSNYKDIETLYDNFFVVFENAARDITCYFRQKGSLIT